MTMEKRSGHGLYCFLCYLASGVDTVPGFECVSLIGVNQDGMVHLLH